MATFFRTAFAKAGVGTLVAMTFGRTNRNPSVSKKKNVLFLIMGPPTEPAHWLALENGRGVTGVGVVVHPVVGVHGPPVPPVLGVAVEFVGSGLGHVGDLGAGQLAILAGVGIRDHRGFFNLVRADGQVGGAGSY